MFNFVLAFLKVKAIGFERFFSRTEHTLFATIAQRWKFPYDFLFSHRAGKSRGATPQNALMRKELALEQYPTHCFTGA